MSGNGHHLADVVESPMDLSQSAANFRTLPNTAAVNISQGCRLSASTGVAGGSITSSVPRHPLMLPTLWGSNVEGHVSCMTSLPLDSACKVIPVPYSAVSQNNVPADIQRSAGGCPMNFHSAVKSDYSAHSVDSLGDRNSARNSDLESDRSMQYPKTKKQKAVDTKVTNLMSSATVDGKVSEYGVLTFGEIQERLITKVVESGSLSRVLSDERHHLMSPSKPHVAGNLPPGQYSQSEAFPNRPLLALEMTSPEHCNLQKACSVPVTSSSLFCTSQKSVTSNGQGLSLYGVLIFIAGF